MEDPQLAVGCGDLLDVPAEDPVEELEDELEESPEVEVEVDEPEDPESAEEDDAAGADVSAADCLPRLSVR